MHSGSQELITNDIFSGLLGVHQKTFPLPFFRPSQSGVLEFSKKEALRPDDASYGVSVFFTFFFPFFFSQIHDFQDRIPGPRFPPLFLFFVPFFVCVGFSCPSELGLIEREMSVLNYGALQGLVYFLCTRWR